MELPGSAYMYTLASLSMTFVGFSAIVIVLRQTAGRELSGWHLVLTRLYVESGFWAAAFCMLPSLLALYGMSQPSVLRASSGVIALVMITYGATYRIRRRFMVREKVPLRRWVPVVAVSTLVVVGLIGNAVGVPYEPGIAPIALAASWTLACGAAIFLAAFDAFWRRSDPL